MRGPLVRLAPRSAALLLAALVTACGSSGTVPSSAAATELANLRLGPAYSHWLVGPLARVATPAEVEAFLALDDDFAALEYVDRFWARRDPDPGARGNEVRLSFERRVAEADRRFGEQGVLGRRTARGTIYVLYGEPESIEFEIPLDGGTPIELWTYPADAEPGLDGRFPASTYRFRERNGVTLPYQPGGRRNTLPPGRG